MPDQNPVSHVGASAFASVTGFKVAAGALVLVVLTLVEPEAAVVELPLAVSVDPDRRASKSRSSLPDSLVLDRRALKSKLPDSVEPTADAVASLPDELPSRASKSRSSLPDSLVLDRRAVKSKLPDSVEPTADAVVSLPDELPSRALRSRSSLPESLVLDRRALRSKLPESLVLAKRASKSRSSLPDSVDPDADAVASLPLEESRALKSLPSALDPDAAATVLVFVFFAGAFVATGTSSLPEVLPLKDASKASRSLKSEPLPTVGILLNKSFESSTILPNEPSKASISLSLKDPIKSAVSLPLKDRNSNPLPLIDSESSSELASPLEPDVEAAVLVAVVAAGALVTLVAAGAFVTFVAGAFVAFTDEREALPLLPEASS
jgi:hypothetical protein